MSDLYLVLHRRLNSVADWVELSTTVMKTARERLGLSYEAVARQIPVSSKTYERYEKRGRVPRPLLARVATILELEVEQPERVRVTVEGENADDVTDTRLREIVHEELSATREQLDRIEAMLQGSPLSHQVKL